MTIPYFKVYKPKLKSRHKPCADPEKGNDRRTQSASNAVLKAGRDNN